jgi:2-polyprenyl-3-methyl-5-hydroxy-6-metoxy-1,4-benzoquinol methylase
MRDYNQEMKDNTARKYAYGFDIDVMHGYMIQSFNPFFRDGNCLELGCNRGDFTLRLANCFSDITCVEASSDALADARKRLGEKADFILGRFEDVSLPQRYDNIILTHVLEHLDDPIGVLKRINDEWLSDNGYLFLVVPNANAPSRQIAVNMGLISHNTAVTEAERQHGHQITYTGDTLARDVKAAGLRIVHRSGIFFKALANFQWDRVIKAGIVTPEYLDGCYELGKVYPDLCASIFLVCGKQKG